MHTARSNLASARELVALLPHWFVFHWVHMDTTLVVAVDFAAGKHPAAPSPQPASGKVADSDVHLPSNLIYLNS